MKKAPTMSALDTLDEIRTSGDIRRVVSNALLALARKEISAADVEAMSKGMDAISNSLAVEVKLARLDMDLRRAGAEIAKTAELGKLLIS